MDVVTRGPVSAASLAWQRGSGWVLTILCKAVIDLVPGEAKLRPEAQPPHPNDVPWDPPYGRSLRFAGDFAPVKANVDVVLTGHAYAPGGRPVPSLVARLAIGELDKSIDVVTDRHFDAAGKLVEGPPFSHMPLAYERAAGGPGSWNAAGIGVGWPDAHGNIHLPNLMPHGSQVTSRDQLHIAPAGFGPLAPDWPSRVEKLGRRSPRDLPPHWNGHAIPDDLAREYFNVAPEDQQLRQLRGDETIVLEHLHPSYPKLTTRLPGLHPQASCEVNGKSAMIALRIDTLHIDTDSATACVVWRGHLPLRDLREATHPVVSLEAPRREPQPQPQQAPSPQQPPSQPRRPAVTGLEKGPPVAISEARDFEATIAPEAMMEALAAAKKSAALPFAPSSGGAGAPNPLSQSSLTWEAAREVRPSPPAASALSPSAGSWGEGAPASEQTRSFAAPTAETAPPPPSSATPFTPAAPKDRPSAPSMPSALPPIAPPPRARLHAVATVPDKVAPPAPAPAAVPAPVPVPAPGPVPAAAPFADSPWAAGAASAPAHETIGMAAVAGALALAAPRPEPAPALEASPAAEGARGSIQLLWFEPDSIARARRVPRWKQLLDDLERRPLDRDIDDTGAREPWEVEDRREMFEILSRGGQLYLRGVEDALSLARGKGGKLVPPLVIVEGDVEVQLDELAALEAAATTAAPLVTPADESLKAAVEAADTFLGRPPQSASPAVCEGLHVRIREAFVREKKGLPADYLDRQTERVLVSGRRYQKRSVLGGVFLRALVWIPGEREGLLCYLPEDLASKLPMYRRFGARLLGDVHPQQDQHEAPSYALRALAVGRSA